MNAATEPMARLHGLIESAEAQLPGRDLGWLQTQRRGAVEAMDRLGLPNRKSEAWRYTSAERLLEHALAPVTEPFTALQESDLDELALVDTDAYRVVFANARLVLELSRLDDLPDGVSVGGLREALEQDPERVAPWLGRAAADHGHVFNALNTALIDDGMLLHVAEGCVLDKPLEVLFLTEPGEDVLTAAPRTLMVLERGARATVIERHASLGQAMYFSNGIGEALLGEDAVLEHYRVQEESPAAFHIHGLFVRQEAGSRYVGLTAALGAAWSRTDFNVDFAGEDAHCELNGLYLAGDRQLVDMHLNVLHQVPGCTSEENFRGILHGKGRAVFDGRILVAQDAQRTDAQLHNANLMLSRSAEVDTKPQLEIYADDVKCSHGTTVGQIEPEQLFYLRSRGIDAAEARKMLCLGFAGEILDACPIEGVRRRAEARLANALAQVDRNDEED